MNSVDEHDGDVTPEPDDPAEDDAEASAVPPGFMPEAFSALTIGSEHLRKSLESISKSIRPFTSIWARRSPWPTASPG